MSLIPHICVCHADILCNVEHQIRSFFVHTIPKCFDKDHNLLQNKIVERRSADKRICLMPCLVFW